MGPAVNVPKGPDRTVLITGAAGPQGQATAISFAAAGTPRIAIMDLVDVSDTRNRALRAALDMGMPAPDVLPLTLNICDASSVEAAIQKVSSRWKHVDIFINVEGSPLSPGHNVGHLTGLRDIDARWKSWEANAKGISLMARALLPLLSRGTEKTIINVIPASSTVSLSSGASGSQLSALAATRLSECLMLDYAHKGLLVYSANPVIDLEGDLQEVREQDIKQREPSGNFLVQLTSKRRHQLAGRHIGCAEDMSELWVQGREDSRSVPLKPQPAFEEFPVGNEDFVPYWASRRGRVPRSSY
ncbi:NAD(P)-binding protein [Colletotrichum sublineola]|nr:NAD(P)-binding protein [Colletotrichum sublineola]